MPNDFWNDPIRSCLLLAGIDEATNATAEIVLFPTRTRPSDHPTIRRNTYTTVDLRDLQSQSTIRRSLQRDTELELNSLAPGIYLLQFSGSAGKQVEKVGGWWLVIGS